MKITPEDVAAVRKVFNDGSNAFFDRAGDQSAHDERDIALGLLLVDIYDRGYEEGRRLHS